VTGRAVTGNTSRLDGLVGLGRTERSTPQSQPTLTPPASIERMAEQDGPFRFRVTGVFTITGRGLVAAGLTEQATFIRAISLWSITTSCERWLPVVGSR